MNLGGPNDRTVLLDDLFRNIARHKGKQKYGPKRQNKPVGPTTLYKYIFRKKAGEARSITAAKCTEQ